MNRGSVSKTVTVPASFAGFNEAPIHESGKCSARSGSRSTRSSFNEAPIHESGK